MSLLPGPLVDRLLIHNCSLQLNCTEQKLSSDIYLITFVTVLFVLVIEAEKLEVCIHKHSYMLEKVRGYQFTNMTDDTVTNFHHNL